MVLSIAASGNHTYAAAGGVKVFVNVQHSGQGSVRVCVSSDSEDLGCKDVQLGLSNPTVVPWQFSPDAVPVGSTFKACIYDIDNITSNCVWPTNSGVEAPWYVTFEAPIGIPINPDGSLGTSNYTVPSHTNDLSSSSTSNTLGAQNTATWGDACRLLDALIVEPCETLTTPDGRDLTPEGIRVFLVCGGLGTLTTLFDASQQIAPRVMTLAKCGGGNAQPNTVNSIVNSLSSFLGK